jgi:hypothetical protein
MGPVTDNPVPPTRVGPILNVPLRALAGFEKKSMQYSSSIEMPPRSRSG